MTCGSNSVTIAPDTPGVPALEVLQTGEAIWVETAADYRKLAPGVFELAKKLDGLRAYGAVPISLDGRIGGVLVFAHPLGHHFDATEKAVFGTLAQHCSQAHRSRAAARDRTQAAHFRAPSERPHPAVVRDHRDLSLSLKVEEKLQVIAKLIVPELADWCVIDLVDGQDIRRVAIEHRDATKVERALQERGALPAQSGGRHAHRERHRPGKAPLLPARFPRRNCKPPLGTPKSSHEFLSEPVVSAIVVPLVVSLQCIGVLSLITSDSGRVYDQEDVAFAREVTRRAGTSISNARLRTALESERAKLRMVFEQAPFPLGVFEGPEHRIVLANSKWEALVRRSLPAGAAAWGRGARAAGAEHHQHA